MKNLFCLFNLLLIFSYLNVLSQATSINKENLRGTVVDAATQQTIPFVTVAVQLNDNLMGTQTDSLGYYKLTLPVGNYQVQFSSVGYNTQTIPISFTKSETKILDVKLQTQSQLLDQIVISGGKFEKKLSHETVTLEVIQPDLIENTNSTQIDEALEKVPGLTIIDGQANIRGGSGYSYGAGSRVLLLLDGLPILRGDSGSPDWSYIPVENIGQVEIIKGAASALYGSAALNGIINVRTAYPKTEPETKFSVFGGVYQNPENNILEVAGVENGDTLYARKSFWNEEGGTQPHQAGFSFAHRQKINENTDLVLGAYGLSETRWREGDYRKRIRLTANTKHRLKKQPNIELGLNTNFQRAEEGLFFLWGGWSETAQYNAYRALPNTLSENSVMRFNIDPSFTYLNDKGTRHRVVGRYYKSKSENNTNQGVNADMVYGEYQFQKRWLPQNLVFNAGITGSYTHANAQLYGDTTYTASNSAIYAQLEKRFFDRLTLSTGARLERNTITGQEAETKPVMRIGANYQLAKYTYLRASYGQGYRFPTIAEKFVTTEIGPIVVAQNPNLQSETGWSAEVGIKQGVGLGEWKGYLDVSAFVNEYEDMMEFTFGGADGSVFGFQSINIGDTRILGLDAVLAGRGKLFGLPTNLLTGYTYTDPKFQNFNDTIAAFSSADYNVLKYRFRHTFKMDVETQINAFSVGVAARSYSNMEAVDEVFNVFVPGLSAYRAANTDGEWVWDMRMAYQINEAVKLAFLVRNLTNNEYALRPALIEAPRSFSLKLDWAF